MWLQYPIICCALSPARPALLPAAHHSCLLSVTQPKALNEQCQRRSRSRSVGNEGTTRDRGAGRSERQVLWEAPGARSYAPCAGAELPGGRKVLCTETNGSNGDITAFSVCIGKFRMALYGCKKTSPAPQIALQNLFLFQTGLNTTNRIYIVTCLL